LVAFGGAGPLHACSLAEEVGIRRVLIPRHPGVLSALGMVGAPESVERSQGLVLRLEEESAERIETAATEIERQARTALRAAGHEVATRQWVADARYEGQSHELRVNVPSLDPEAIGHAFHGAHDREYGYSTASRAVVLVTLRCRVEAQSGPYGPAEAARSSSQRVLDGEAIEREALGPGDRIVGPVVITQEDATTYVAEGWQGEVDRRLNLILELYYDG
jgi:N-methylhydantoinase A